MIITVSDNRDFVDTCECGKPAEPLTFMIQHLVNEETGKAKSWTDSICSDCVAIVDADEAYDVFVLRVQVAG
jgi:hypothetical protein